MSGRIFQNVVLQLKENTDRTVGVIDGEGIVIACSELSMERLASSGWAAARFRLLPYSAVGVESGLLLAVRLDWASVNGKKRERLLLALSPTPVGDGCDALWGELET